MVNNSLVVVVLASGVLYGTPLLYGALGELLAERSGVLNLGVEGMMLMGAVMGFWAVERVDGPKALVLAVAVGVAALAGAVMAAIHAFLVITLRANQIVSGLALTIFAGAAGLSSYLGNDLHLSGKPARYQFQEILPSSGRSSSASPCSCMRPGSASCSRRCTSLGRGWDSTCALSASRRRRQTRWG